MTVINFHSYSNIYLLGQTQVRLLKLLCPSVHFPVKSSFSIESAKSVEKKTFLVSLPSIYDRFLMLHHPPADVRSLYSVFSKNSVRLVCPNSLSPLKLRLSNIPSTEPTLPFGYIFLLVQATFGIEFNLPPALKTPLQGSLYLLQWS